MSIQSLFTYLTSLLFPEKCIVCKKEGISLCASCIQTLPVAPFLEASWMHSLFSYQDTNVRKTIYALKFNHTQSVGEFLAPIMHDFIQDVQSQKLEHIQYPLILIPVPRMQAHLAQRGFDAVLYLAKSIAGLAPNEYKVIHDAVVRINTKAQVGLSRSERLVNMKNAFKIINSTIFHNQTICIIDDVITTGSTLQELRKIILEAGAKDVFAITIAH